MADGEENIPRDIKMIKALLTSMGVENYEPRVVHQFLELFYRISGELLMDAKTYSEHADKTIIDHDDVELAIKLKSYLGSTLPSVSEVEEAALKVNKIEYPELRTLGPSLPPNRKTLISPDDQRELEKIHSIKTVVDFEKEKDVSEVVPTVPKPPEEQRTNLLPKTNQRVSFPLGRGTGRQR